MKQYGFSITIWGIGEDENEAWHNAIDELPNNIEELLPQGKPQIEEIEGI